MNQLKRMATLSFLSVIITLGAHPAHADDYSSFSVYTEKYYQFTIHNTASTRVSFEINGSPLVLGPGESKKYKYNKARGTNGDNVVFSEKPSIKLNSGRTEYALGLHPDVYIVETENGNVDLQSNRPIAKAEPMKTPEANQRPYPQKPYRNNPQQPYRPNAVSPVGSLCFTYSNMRCLKRGVAPIGTPCSCFSPYGPIYGKIMY